MDIEELKKIIDSPLSGKEQEYAIIVSLSKDESVVSLITEMLNRERESKRAIITDMNLELSRAHIYIDGRPETKSESKEHFNKSFILDKIANFYIKYKSIVTHCFNRF